MSDPWVTGQMQVRDLLLHNSGLREGAGDLMFWPEPNLFTRADVMAGSRISSRAQLSLALRLRQHDVRRRGRSRRAAAGTSYEELVRRSCSSRCR
jgi:hypothetical protein